MTKKLGTLIRRVMLVFGGEDVSETNRLPVDAGITDPLPISGSVTADTELSAAAQIADDAATPNTSKIASYNMGYDANASNWNMVRHGTVYNLHTGSGYDPNTGVNLRQSGASGSVETGTTANPLPVEDTEAGTFLESIEEYLADGLLYCDTSDVEITSMPDITIEDTVAPSYIAHPFGAVTVSTTASLILSFNGGEFGWFEIQNNGTGTLYVGSDNTVTTSGATMGLRVLPGGSLTINPGAVKSGTMSFWGIYSEAAASQNISYMALGEFPD